MYASPAEMADAAVPFVARGLEDGEDVLVVAPAASLRAIDDRLQGDRARLHLVDREGWDGQWPGPALATYDRFARDRLDAGAAGVRIVSELAWHHRSRLERAEWARMESALNVALAGLGGPVSLLCPYDDHTFTRADVDGALETHPTCRSGSLTEPCLRYVDPARFLGRPSERPAPPPPASVDAEMTFGNDLRAVRRFVDEEAVRAGIDGPARDELLLSVNEVATNVLLHGDGQGVVRFWREPGMLACEVEGQGGVVDDPFVTWLPAIPGDERGRGLWIVRQLCPVVELWSNATGTTVRLHVPAEDGSTPVSPNGHRRD